jgi:hypothetical protein
MGFLLSLPKDALAVLVALLAELGEQVGVVCGRA